MEEEKKEIKKKDLESIQGGGFPPPFSKEWHKDDTKQSCKPSPKR